MKQNLKNILPFAEAFSKLLHPFAEVVVHDLEKDQIEAIYNPFSRREIGDDSYLDRVDFSDTDTIIGPYSKTNWDGRPLKSISIVIRDEKGRAEGFLCVNVDVSFFESAQQVLAGFLNNTIEMSQKSEKLFKEDLYEKINLFVQEYCRSHQVSLDALTREDKKSMIAQLFREGAFDGKNAATYVGRVLGVSRATVYNYLKELS